MEVSSIYIIGKNQRKKRTSVLLTLNLFFKSFLGGSRGAVFIFPTAVQGNEDLLDSSVIKLCPKCARFLHSVFFLDLIFDPNHPKYKKINKIKTKLRRTHFFSGNFRMLLPTVLLGSVLIFIPHFPFGAYAKLYVDCTFERIKSSQRVRILRLHR